MRCGEILIERYVPAALQAYRQIFAVPLGDDAPSAAGFADLYPVDPTTLAALRAEVLDAEPNETVRPMEEPCDDPADCSPR